MKTIIKTILISALFVAIMPINNASAATPTCPLSATGDEVLINFSGKEIYSNVSPKSITHPGVSIPAGTYTITAVTYDNHSVHGGQNQTAEKVKFAGYEESGKRMFLTGGTTDIPESRDYQTTTFASNFTFNETVKTLLAAHAAEGTPNYQSVTPLCIKFTPVSTPVPNIQASCSVNPTSAQTGQNVTWTANATGGTGTYTYSWSGADTNGSTSKTVTKSYSTTGTKTATVTVTSGTQTATATCATNITSTPNPSLQVSCSANPSSVQINQNVTWDANATGGTGSYTYSWTTGQTSENFTTSYTSTGTKTQTVTVTSGGNSASATCSLNVTNTPTDPTNPSVSCRVSNTRIEKGEVVRFSADASGGRSPYNYDWDLDIDGDDQYEDVRFNNTGSYRARVTITDQNGKISQSTCPTVVVEEDDDDDNDLNVSCRVSDTRIEEGDSVTYEVRIRDGRSPYDIDWRGDISGDDEKERVRYNRSGTYEVSVRVKDRNGNTDTANCPDVRVEDEDEDNDDKITVTANTNLNRPTGNLASLDSVFLSQIPYTGPGDVAKVLGVIAIVGLWSAIIALHFRKNRVLKTKSNKIQEFKNQNKVASTIK